MHLASSRAATSAVLTYLSGRWSQLRSMVKSYLGNTLHLIGERPGTPEPFAAAPSR